MEDKHAIRERMARSREGLSETDRRAKSARILERLRDVADLNRPGTIMSYVDVGGEVVTTDAIREWISEGREVVAPIAGREGVLSWGIVDDVEALAPGRYGIAMPTHEIDETPDDIAAVIVPVVAFTPACDRLGRGVAYYDRFLAGIAAPKIGLAFEFQRVDEMPVEPHDVPLDTVITESNVYSRTK